MNTAVKTASIFKSFKFLSFLMVFLIGLQNAYAGDISFASLLEEMTNRKEAAKWPAYEYQCGQFSSYDRNSTAPTTAGWWANWDRSYFLRVEENQGRKEYVLMDAEGPGAVVRFWTTWHGPDGSEFSNGLLRVYLDNSSTPTLEAPATDFISKGYLAGPPLSQGVSPLTEYRWQGHDLYLPIPYAKHCKITYETKTFIEQGGVKSEALYYQINFRRYKEGTPVQTFSMEDLEKHAALLKHTQNLLKEGGCNVTGKTKALTGMMEPNGMLSADLTGEKAIGTMQFRFKAKDLSQALRSVVLEIEFDGKRTVWCPVGDFFGTGYRIHAHKTWYTDVHQDGTMSCYWVMPFKKQASITLQNLGEQPVEVETGNITADPWHWDNRSMYFHAAWKQWSDIRTRRNPEDPENGASDLNWITIQGRGKYIGDVLTLYNNAPQWWGEGDEKIYVDGESFPSHFGTGTEDYYGYAWCRPAPFSAPFHAQPCGAGNLDIGFTVNSRFRSLDAIPFNTSLQFDMELWHWVETDMDYAPTVFWYADSGASWNVQPMPREARRPVSNDAAAGVKAAATYRNPIIDQIGPADPSVIKYKGKYYLYPTWNGAGCNVFVSDDLVHWAGQPMCFKDARGGVWAPDVFYNQKGDGKLYLYYTVDNPKGGKLIGVAVSDDPLGPFVDKGNLAVDNIIDAHLFEDEDGKLYLYYVKTGDRFIIFVQPMSDPLTKMGRRKEVLRPTVEWEQRRGRITEGPWMLKHDGIYYLMYSGSGADGPEYAIGYATSDSPMGPFTKYENNPIVKQGNGVYGPGHNCVIEGLNGDLWMIYHQQNSDKVGWDRFLAMDPLWFDEEGVLHAKTTRGTDEKMERNAQ